MTYVSPNFRTKEALKEALSSGTDVSVFEPGIGRVPHDGIVYLEGPHYPEPHKWYAKGVTKDGKLISIF